MLQLAGASYIAHGLAALYVPAGVPITSRMLEDGSFAHVDLHLEAAALERGLNGMRLRRDPCLPQFISEAFRLRLLARLFADEICQPMRPAKMLEGLLVATLAEVFEASHDGEFPGEFPAFAEAPTMQRGGLTPFQLAAVQRRFEQVIDRPLSVDEMARAAGLSESWFAHAFKKTTGLSPQRWQMQQRLAMAARMIAEDHARPLADIALATGFSDQPHFSRAFRAEYGQPPATWRRSKEPRFLGGTTPLQP
jgi:AraC family transcriptional regulator